MITALKFCFDLSYKIHLIEVNWKDGGRAEEENEATDDQGRCVDNVS